MPTLTEGLHAGAFIVQEMPGYYSRDALTVALNQTLAAGQICYKAGVPAGETASVAAEAGNTGGAGVITMDPTTPVLAGAQNGNYRVICIEPGTNAGVFEVFDPQGVSIGRANAAGAAFASQIKFTISDATDFASGDAFTITVNRESVTDEQASALPNDGSQVANAIIMYPCVTDGVSTKQSTFLVRPCEVRASDLTWPAGISAANKGQAIEQLRNVGIILR